MFGEFLVEKGIVGRDELNRALGVSKFRKVKLGRLMVELGFINRQQLDSALIDYLQPFNGEKYQDLKEKVDAVALTPEQGKFLASVDVVLCGLTQERVEGLVRQFSDELVQRLELFFRRPAYLRVAEPYLLDILVVGTTKRETKEAALTVSRDLNDDQKIAENDPYARILKNCFESAKSLGASDIHFEPYDLDYLIRFRVHGHLSDWKRLSSDHTLPLTSKLKWIINMDLGIIGKPQDSRATLHSLGIDIRGSSMPVTSGGEKIVIRLQYQEKTLNIRQLGIRESKLKVLLESITKSEGLILISGPTGSGKTTTLYALLEEMDRLGKNISTLENPVEKQLARVNQANISDYKDFANFQRALMRQDPDVILLGEIRDSETAELSLKLASTGHLVLSTIHANGAVQVIDRLTNLGADRFSIKTNLRLSVAQRLLRLICPECSEPATSELLSRVEKTGNYRVSSFSGCKHCHQGVTGRVAVIEHLARDEIVKLGVEDLVVTDSLAFECLELAKEGRIDIRDALFFT